VDLWIKHITDAATNQPIITAAMAAAELVARMAAARQQAEAEATKKVAQEEKKRADAEARLLAEAAAAAKAAEQAAEQAAAVRLAAHAAIAAQGVEAAVANPNVEGIELVNPVVTNTAPPLSRERSATTYDSAAGAKAQRIADSIRAAEKAAEARKQEVLARKLKSLAPVGETGQQSLSGNATVSKELPESKAPAEVMT
jgi:dTMP kinase